MKIKPVILCGGSGSRLWPKSRKNFPKQFIDFGGWNLFERTLERIKNSIFDSPIISTNLSYLSLVKKYPQVKIYSPSDLYSLSINKISNGDIIKTSLNKFKILSSPGHTIDHIVLCDYNNNLLFVGDVLFRLGCGRIFEGTFEQMHNSLQNLLGLPNEMKVYCGHEYTINNLNFLEHVFKNNVILEETKNKILKDLNSKGRSIPFNLGEEKICNPFLNQECEMGSEFRKKNKYSNYELFRYLRERKDNF